MRFRDGYRKRDDDDEETMIRVHHMDLYDQGLLDLKQLVNEKNEAPENRKRPYSIAIENLILELAEMAHGEGIPKAAFKQDIEEALKGGKYRKLYQDPTIDDVINIDRKKKSSKAKPKRKVTKKVVKKCKCKK